MTDEADRWTAEHSRYSMDPSDMTDILCSGSSPPSAAGPQHHPYSRTGRSSAENTMTTVASRDRRHSLAVLSPCPSLHQSLCMCVLLCMPVSLSVCLSVSLPLSLSLSECMICSWHATGSHSVLFN